MPWNCVATTTTCTSRQAGQVDRVIDACSTACLPTYAVHVADTSAYVCINSHLRLDNKVSTRGGTGHVFLGSASARLTIDHRGTRGKKSGSVCKIVGI